MQYKIKCLERRIKTLEENGVKSTLLEDAEKKELELTASAP